MMRSLLILIFIAQVNAEDVTLVIAGDQSEFIQFMVLPFTYEGDGLNPAVTIEDVLKQALSSTGLLRMPLRIQSPENPDDMYYWQYQQIRYVIKGHIYETKDALVLQLIVDDAYGLQSIDSRFVLKQKNLRSSVQQLSDQLYRSLFYATFTNQKELRFLANENRRYTRYLHALVRTFKFAWNSDVATGICDLTFNQLPGGVILEKKLEENCFDHVSLAAEIESLFNQIESLPYNNYRSVFLKQLNLRFIRLDREGRKAMIRSEIQTQAEPDNL